MTILSFALVGSGLMLLGANAIVRAGAPRGPSVPRPAGRTRWVGVWCVVVLVLAFGCLFVSPVLIVNAVLLCLTAWLWARRQASTRAFLLSSLAVTAGSYLAVGSMIYRDLTRAAARFPFESLEERLAYEQAGPSPADGAGARPPDGRRVPAGGELEEMVAARSMGRAWLRSRQLERIHENFVGAFVNSPGFGVMRMGPVGLTLPADEPIDQRRPARPSADPTVADERLGERPPTRLGLDRASDASGPLWGLHAKSIVSFANADGFGYVKDRRRVAGFQPHHFRAAPASFDLDADDRARWQVARLELVSLLKHRLAAVYVSEHLPRMSELRDAPTRPLDAFEARAVARLRDGEDLVAEAAAPGFRAVGAIRAARNCLACHAVAEGALLGAFAYQFGKE